jgi:hypothetical protein
MPRVDHQLLSPFPLEEEVSTEASAEVLLKDVSPEEDSLFMDGSFSS